MCRIVAKEFITKDVVKLTFESKNIAQLALPGQFVNISTSDDTMLLKRPISICEIKGNNIIVCFKIIGKGTKKISEKKVNDTIEVIGPLGNGFPLIKKRKLLLIGGGCGIFPLLEVAKRAYKENVLQIILAARNQDELYLQEEFKKSGQVHLLTDDGSCGYQKNPLEFLDNHAVAFDVFFACGPKVLLQKLDEKYYQKKEGYLSYEERMACGIGACYGCVVKATVDSGYVRVCKDGPIFPLGVLKYES